MYTVFFRVRRDDLGGVNLFPFDTQQFVGGDAEDFRQLRQRADVRAGLVVFPFAHGLGGDAHPLRKGVLGQSQTLAGGDDPLSQCFFHILLITFSLNEVHGRAFALPEGYPSLQLPISCHNWGEKAIKCSLIWAEILLNRWLKRTQPSVVDGCACKSG